MMMQVSKRCVRGHRGRRVDRDPERGRTSLLVVGGAAHVSVVSYTAGRPQSHMSAPVAFLDDGQGRVSHEEEAEE